MNIPSFGIGLPGKSSGKARGLHVAIFFASICGRFLSERRLFFCTVYLVWHFPLVSINDSEKRGKSSLSSSIFETEFQSSVRNVHTALPDPVYSTPNIYAVTVILRGQVVHSPQRSAEKKSQRSAWSQSSLFQCDLFFLQNRLQILVEKNHNI